MAARHARELERLTACSALANPPEMPPPRAWGGALGVQGRVLPSARLEGHILVPTMSKKGLGEVEDGGGGRVWGWGVELKRDATGRIAPGWKRAAGGGLRDAFKRYSQVKYQVVVALFGDAVVEPHCGRDRRVMG